MQWRRVMKATTHLARLSDNNLIHSESTRNGWTPTLAFRCKDEYITCRGKAASLCTVAKYYLKKHSAQWRSYGLRTAGVDHLCGHKYARHMLELVDWDMKCEQARWAATQKLRCLVRISTRSSKLTICSWKVVFCILKLKSAKVTQRRPQIVLKT